MKIVISLLLLISTFLFSNVAVSNVGSEIPSPFGIENRKYPTTEYVKLIDVRAGIETQQVCGYSDWTQAHLISPGKILSSQFFKPIGNKMVRSAKRSMAVLSGAIPGMLFCNASATFCQIFQHSQLIASAQYGYTKDDCKILEGLENNSNIQSEVLASCIKETTTIRPDLDNSQAREMCLRNDNDAGRVASKSEKLRNASRGSTGNIIDTDKFLLAIFPKKARSQNSDISLGSGAYKFSRRTKSYSMAKELIPGLTVNGTFTTSRGGTFQPALEVQLSRETQDIEKNVYVSMKLMKKFVDSGNNARQSITKFRKLILDKKRWSKDGRPAILRDEIGKIEPSFLISPNQIYQLLGFFEPGSKNEIDSSADSYIQTLAKRTAMLKTQQVLSEIHFRAITSCTTNQELQGAQAQKYCNSLAKVTKANIEALKILRETDSDMLDLQKEMSFAINNIQRERLSKDRINLNLSPLMNESGDHVDTNFRKVKQ